jgi:hypothetical protein
MFGPCARDRLITHTSEVVRSTRIRPFLAMGGVTALLFLLTLSRTALAQEGGACDFRVFEFTCRFNLPMGSGRLDGLTASDGITRRIAIYWIEPYLCREGGAFVCYSDFLITSGTVHYWTHGMPQPGSFPLLDGSDDFLLPSQKTPECIVQSVLAIVKRTRRAAGEADVPLEVGTFFERSRGHAEYRYGVLSREAGPPASCNDAFSAERLLNALPYGREYLKETEADGAIVWRVQRALSGSPIATLTVKHVGGVERNCCSAVFNIQTLGQWTLIPEAYRAYWSFDLARTRLSASPDPRAAGRRLHDEIDAYLEHNKLPSEVRRACDRLRFKTALMTGDSNCVWRSTSAAVAGLCDGDAVPTSQLLFELGSMSGQIQSQYPQGIEKHLRPLVVQMAQNVGRQMSGNLDLLMAEITANGWYVFGKLVLEEARRRSLMEKCTADSLTARLEASQTARGIAPPDPCESTRSIRQYLSQLDADPPKGALDMGDVRHILDEGLAKSCAQAGPQMKAKLVGDVIRSIHLIVGDGPFCGDPTGLTESIERFSELSLAVEKVAEPIDTVLATFLALSFCDISTREDHDVLSSQIGRLSKELQSEVNAMLQARSLALLVGPEDVRGVFALHERVFRRYMDDPLWPAFKFPLTSSEEVRLAAKLNLRLAQLGPVLDDISLKVKYGGASAHLKDRTTHEISRIAQQILPQTAFLRNPPYPGVSCQYRGGYGFTAMIRGPLYQEDKRPKETFRAMKYFHLGHRLQEIVEHERELLTPPRVLRDD